MARGFVGRDRELSALDRMLQRVAQGGPGGRSGRALLMRGRRRVGKSRLVEEFVERAGVPHLYFTASAQPTVEADLAGALRDATSALLVSAERALAAEFPLESQAGLVLGAIGAGERAYSLIARAAGGISPASLGAQVPGAAETTPLVAVSRSGAATAGLLVLGPDDLLTAYRS